MSLLTLEQVADELAVSTATVRRIVSSGKLSYVRIGKLMRFSREELCRYIKEATITGLESRSTEKEHRESCRGYTHEQAKALEAKIRQDFINETK